MPCRNEGFRIIKKKAVEMIFMLLSMNLFAQPYPDVPTVVQPGNMETGRDYRFLISAYDRQDDRLSYFIDWGDGVKEGWSEFIQNNTTLIRYHSYPPNRNHTYTLVVRVKDDKGNESGISCIQPFPINTTPGNPEIPNGPCEGKTGQSYRFTTSALDPDGDNVRFQIDWGDGMVEDTEMVSNGQMISRSHAWNSEGTFMIKARTCDEGSFNNQSGWSNFHEIRISRN
jgi:hypothetical protein